MSFDWKTEMNGTITDTTIQQRLQQLQETWDWVQEQL